MIQCRSKIAILLATYNGAAFLREQLDSLLHQSCQDWCLYVHDDGSADDTCLILSEYAKTHPDKIILLDYPPQGGACRNFWSLLERIQSDYYMFCDQDDVWLPEKIEQEMLAMQIAEQNNPEKAVVVATDLKVVDSQLQLIDDSLWHMAGIYPQYVQKFDEMAANTLVTGCTILMNQKVKDVLRPLTPRVFMHDAWIASCVRKAQGVLECLPVPMVLYRQHGGNTLGAQSVARQPLRGRLKRLRRSRKINRDIYRMLSELHYGSILKFVYYKYMYRIRIKRDRY